MFRLRILTARSKTLVRELLYADVTDFVAHSERDMRMLADRFSMVSTAFGLAMSLKKMKVFFTLPPDTPFSEANIYVNGTRLSVASTSVYLGNTLSWDGSLDAEMHTRI